MTKKEPAGLRKPASTVAIYLENREEFRQHLLKLKEKYGGKGVPLSEAMKFDFKIGSRSVDDKNPYNIL